MTDTRRLNHLFALLAQMHKETGGDVWDRFIQQYSPTESEKVKLKALYESYFVKKGAI